MADSSFSYTSIFRGKTLMVVIPHEDDEINVAGSTIHGAILEGVHVICVFSTWGDDLYTPRRMMSYSLAIRMEGVMGNLTLTYTV